MATNITWMDSADTIVDVFAGISTTSSLFFPLLLISLAVLIYIVFHNWGTENVVLFEGFALSILALLFFVAGYLTFIWVFFPLFILFVGIAFKVFG